MSDHQHDIKPLDPGRVNTIDPFELQYWCEELGCSEEALKSAVAEVGEHIAAVREELRKTDHGA